MNHNVMLNGAYTPAASHAYTSGVRTRWVRTTEPTNHTAAISPRACHMNAKRRMVVRYSPSGGLRVRVARIVRPTKPMQTVHKIAAVHSSTSPDDDLATLARAEEGRRGEVDVSPATEGAA